jgi:putative phosphoesterase
MKIAAISDIHANLHALDAVLEDISKQNCDVLVVAGDFIDCGPFPAETIRKLRPLMPVIIRGNHEGYILDHIFSDKFEHPPFRALYAPGKWAAACLTTEEKDWLASLPTRIELNYGADVNVLVVHGSPRRNNEPIYPNIPDELLEEMFEGEIRPHRLVIAGHTHRPALIRWREMTLVNCGSVGYPIDRDTRSCYAIAEWNGEDWLVHHRRVEYNRNAALKAIKKNASLHEAGPIMRFIQYLVETGTTAGMSEFVNRYIKSGDHPTPPDDMEHLEMAVIDYLEQFYRNS